jgi:hypothetical protein
VVDQLTICSATAEDAVELSGTMQPADCDEVMAASGHAPIEALLIGLQTSAECWCARVDGEVLAMWGVVGRRTFLGGGCGVGWLLTSTRVDQHPLTFWRACKAELAALLSRWSVLINAIDCRHERALRWAARLGFCLAEPEPFGTAGLPFRRFAITRGDLRHV